jgi:2,3-bisphosphoglycerate-dependent phosphoglycerate mutase
MPSLVIIRHGESEWNRSNRFTGWRDVDLTKKGREEASAAGRLLREDRFTFDIAFTSVLKRAVKTLSIVLDEMDLTWIPVHKSWRLNERHYGALEGLDKAETAQRFGRDKVLAWRRSFKERPPTLDDRDGGHPRFDPRYHGLRPDELPNGESLEDTHSRFLVCWKNMIEPALAARRRVLVVAHQNSLRALAMHIENISETDIVSMNLPTGVPRVYDLDENLHPVNGRFHGDVDEVQQRIDSALASTNLAHVGAVQYS